MTCLSIRLSKRTFLCLNSPPRGYDVYSTKIKWHHANKKDETLKKNGTGKGKTNSHILDWKHRDLLRVVVSRTFRNGWSTGSCKWLNNKARFILTKMIKYLLKRYRFSIACNDLCSLKFCKKGSVERISTNQ